VTLIPPREFLVPAELEPATAVARMAEGLPGVLREETPHTATVTLLDTFDRRVLKAGGFLELEATGQGRRLRWWPPGGGGPEAETAVAAEPRFVSDLPPGRLRETLTPILDVRAVLPVVTLRSRLRPLDLLDPAGKTVARVHLEEHRVLGPGRRPRGWVRRLRLLPVRGYDEAARAVETAARDRLGLLPAEMGAYVEALALVGRGVADYDPRPDVPLSPDARADAALKTVLQHLLDTVLANEDGVRRHIDTEFLHDLRVAVRRARSALGQVRQVLPARLVEGLREELGWLGTSTNLARDVDVYLLAFEGYQGRLPPELQPHLDPFRGFLLEHQVRAYHELGGLLASARYRRLVQRWRALLRRQLPRRPSARDAAMPIDRVARKRTWRAYRRVMRGGGKIRPGSPARDLHRVRIACKKLRYLMEFFRALYPPEVVGRLIRALKVFQDNLGEYQDLEVQRDQLRRFESEMARAGALPAHTREAMEYLVETLAERQAEVRQAFAERFQEFSAPEVRAEFEGLFAKAHGKGKKGRR
jgi:CHAD domain-containing protein